MAGPETISVAMGFMLQFLVQYQQTQMKICEEIDEIIGQSRIPTQADFDRYK